MEKKEFDKKSDMLAARIASKLRNDEPVVYIASAFFDDMSKEWVTCKEDEFTGMNVPFFSPRQDGIDFNAVSGQLRSERIKSIFKNNIRYLNICSDITVNLTPCLDRLDIGTLFEFGYKIGKDGEIDFDNFENYNSLAVSSELKDIILSINKNLGNARVPESVVDKVITFIHKGEGEKVNDTLELLGFDYEAFEVSSTLSNLDKLKSGKMMFLIDHFPFQLFILMGWMFAKKIPYYTCSFNGYGSNVMIAASSKGHIQLPGLVDDTYNKNLK